MAVTTLGKLLVVLVVMVVHMVLQGLVASQQTLALRDQQGVAQLVQL
jgi:hypothetical protein